MGFSSQAISVKSSINLSDINIDTDLNMGSNTIIINSQDIFDSTSLVSNNEETVKSFNDDDEYTGVTNTISNPVILDTYTILEDGYIFGKIKATLLGSNGSAESYIELLLNNDRFENPIYAKVTGFTYTSVSSSILRPQFVKTGDVIKIVHYMNSSSYSGKRKLVSAEIKFLPLVPANIFLELPIDDFTFSI